MVREAIGIPHAATAVDAEIRREILYQRLLHTVAFLDHILGAHAGDYPAAGIPQAVAWLRHQLARHPARGYKTWDELKTELQQPPAFRPRQAGAGARSGRPGWERRRGRPAPGRQPWICRGCGGQFTGRRPPGGRCPGCNPLAIP